MKRYETVIGLEVHVELSTASKIFCACSTKFGEKPNSNSCPICIGMPGAMPILNKKVVEYAILVGLALNCTISKKSILDRKNYFYPDLPKAYQISQLYFPIARNGRITIDTDDKSKSIGIHELHIEEDAGKLIHDSDKNMTLVDYNRSGVPLIEIVSEPDMRSAEEVKSYLEKLRTMLRYLGVSDCKMQEGSMRVDINLSVREVGDTRLGTRTEIKNMNSLKAISRAIEGESKRQIDILQSGGLIDQETRRWDDNENESVRMRLKEEADDYRYFPEPDIAPLEISDEWIHELMALLPEFQDEKILRYQKDYGISEYEAGVLTSSKEIANLFERATRLCNLPKEVSNWLMVEGMRILKDNYIDPWDICLTPERLSTLILMIEEGRINRIKGKEVFEKSFLEDVDPEDYVKKHGLEMISDDKMLRKVVVKVLEDNPQSVSDYKNGKTKAFDNLVGQTMKSMKGKADPALVNTILKEMLEN
ncbi:MAG: Asp-tRNA(Asn)/Glu-tRNA(Gln) amidotransferase subunit GatB [Anaerolineaceae bacterium]|nr:MAG: Asp-tRNA(Asn)/Glu-tRNA(Gln) amidotransferase subunit GatB [Anaerolineaceae bacterium]